MKKCSYMTNKFQNESKSILNIIDDYDPKQDNLNSDNNITNPTKENNELFVSYYNFNEIEAKKNIIESSNSLFSIYSENLTIVDNWFEYAFDNLETQYLIQKFLQKYFQKIINDCTLDNNFVLVF